MSWIVYGIAEAGRAAGEALPAGLNDEAISPVEEGRLAALVSPLPEARPGVAGVEQALLYAEVIDRLHRRMTILPMRYGCLVASTRQVAEFLRRHEAEFSEALATIDGCEEMGVRLLLPAAGGAEGRPTKARTETEPGETSGAAYLEARRRFYEEREREERACREWAERVKAAFSGLVRWSSRECMLRPEGSLLSLSFLVERSDVSAFQAAFSELRRAHPVTAICSGPWPPYVFGAGLAKPEMAAAAEAGFLHR